MNDYKKRQYLEDQGENQFLANSSIWYRCYCLRFDRTYHLLHCNGMSRQPKSVLNPTTQINKLCQPSGGPTKPMASTDYLLNLNKSKLGAYYWLICNYEKSGCRVSEALNIRVAAISPEGGY